jgi:rRNA-processing protein FCF1
LDRFSEDTLNYPQTKFIQEMKKKLAASKKAGLKVILDANFFFIPIQFNLDIFEELAKLLKKRYEPIVLSSTKKELQGLAESTSTKITKQALTAINLLDKCCFVPVEKSSTETYDDVIVRVATESKIPVATNDRNLRKRLRQLGVAVIYMRQKQRLALDGSV